MTSALRSLPVLLCIALTPAARAENLILENGTDRVLVVQTACYVRGVPRPDAVYQVSPGKTTPAINLAGTKLITITDARNPNRPLYEGAIPARTDDQCFLIVPTVPPTRVRLEQRPFPRR
jgi:hypothetical protein